MVIAPEMMISNGVTLRSLHPVVNNRDVVEERFELFDELVVLGMWEIDGAVRFALERDEEAMGEPLGESFRAVVCSPFEVMNHVDLLRQFLKSLDEGVQLLWSRLGFEFEEDHVAQQGGFCFVSTSGIHQETGNEQQGDAHTEQNESFHDTASFQNENLTRSQLCIVEIERL